jgi:hypothetical protein
MSRRRLGELLIDLGLIDEEQLSKALLKQRAWKKRLGETLVELKMISDRQVAGVLAQQLNMPAVDLGDRVVDPRLAQQLGEEFCRRNECLPFAYHERGRFLDLAMSNPLNLEIFEHVRVRTRCNPRPFVVGPVTLKRALSAIFGTDTSEVKIPTAEFEDVGIAGERMLELGSGDFQALRSSSGLPSVDIDVDEPSVSVARPLGERAGPVADANAIQELRVEIAQLKQLLGQTNNRLDYLVKLLESAAAQGTLRRT